jgi:hypothetical protein
LRREPFNVTKTWASKGLFCCDYYLFVVFLTNLFNRFHSETLILTTIFALLFWDVIFADIPGAFETPYQSAPMDLMEDSFYYARKEMIEQRLSELREGTAREILERHDDKYRAKETYCVGVRWDLCPKQDLVEIVEVSFTRSLLRVGTDLGVSVSVASL